MASLGDKKNEVHQWFDKLWRNHFERDEYYKRLSEAMGISYEKCHFSLMNSKQLDKALEIVKKWWWEEFDK